MPFVIQGFNHSTQNHVHFNRYFECNFEVEAAVSSTGNCDVSVSLEYLSLFLREVILIVIPYQINYIGIAD